MVRHQAGRGGGHAGYAAADVPKAARGAAAGQIDYEEDAAWESDGGEEVLPEDLESEAAKLPSHGKKPPVVEIPPPARERRSTFGDDDELSTELPSNWTLREFQEKAKTALTEFFISRATNDSVASLKELLSTCPSEADELGVVALRYAVDKDEACQEALVELLCSLQKSSSLLDRAALVRSFEKLFCTWEDLAIDAPKAPEVLLQMLRGCIACGVLDRSLLTKLPENLINAGITKAGEPVAEMISGVAAELKSFKKQIVSTLEEYFVALNPAEVETFLKELGMPAYHHELVKKAIIMSFSQANIANSEHSREAAVTLLRELSRASTLTKDDLQWGVTRVLGQLEDLELDCPKSSELAMEFISAMVEHELVSVPFLRRCRMLRIGGHSGLRVIDGALRRTPEYSKKHLGTNKFKLELQSMILEYFNSSDEAEFCRCVSELAPLSPAQSAELVRKVMLLGMERSGGDCELAVKLLVRLARDEEIQADGFEAGFDELYARMPDIVLDVPDAREMSKSFVVEAKKAELLRHDWVPPATA